MAGSPGRWTTSATRSLRSILPRRRARSSRPFRSRNSPTRCASTRSSRAEPCITFTIYGALSKLQRLLVPGGRLIVVEHAFDRLDERTAGWYLENRRAKDPHAPLSLQACLAEWEADHAGLHGYTAMRRELGLRFTERWFAWTPSLHLELGKALEGEELSLIEDGSIQATGFEYVGEWSG
jgi:hypothetical protein